MADMNKTTTIPDDKPSSVPGNPPRLSGHMIIPSASTPGSEEASKAAYMAYMAYMGGNVPGPPTSIPLPTYPFSHPWAANPPYNQSIKTMSFSDCVGLSNENVVNGINIEAGSEAANSQINLSALYSYTNCVKHNGAGTMVNGVSYTYSDCARIPEVPEITGSWHNCKSTSGPGDGKDRAALKPGKMVNGVDIRNARKKEDPVYGIDIRNAPKKEH